MKKQLLFSVVLVIGILLSSTLSAVAQGPDDVYVDPSRAEGNEDGTEEHPYNTTREGEAYAQSLPDGANLHVKNEDGTWRSPQYVPPVVSGGQGVPLPQLVLYILLAVLTIGLTLAGWLFRRRARQLAG